MGVSDLLNSRIPGIVSSNRLRQDSLLHHVKHVCMYVCLHACLRNHLSKRCQIFCVCWFLLLLNYLLVYVFILEPNHIFGMVEAMNLKFGVHIEVDECMMDCLTWPFLNFGKCGNISERYKIETFLQLKTVAQS